MAAKGGMAERYGVGEQVEAERARDGGFAGKYNVRVNVSKLRDPRNRFYLRWMWEQSEGYRWQILLITVLNSLSTWVGLQMALVNRDLIDSITAGDMDGFRRMLVILLLINIGTRALSAFVSWLGAWTSSSLTNTMRLRLIDKMLHRDYGEVARVRSQDWINRLTGDIASVTGVIIGQLSSLVNIIVTLITAISILNQLEPMFIWLAVASVLPAFITYKWIAPVNREYEQVSRFVGIRANSFIQEQVLRLPVTRAFGMADRVEAAASREFDTQRELILDKNRWDRRIGYLYSAYTVFMSLALLGYGGWRVIRGTMSYGTIGAIVTMFNQIRGPLKALLGIVPSFLTVFVFVERLAAIESIPDTLGDELLSEEEARAFYEDELVALGLDGVTFTYPDVSNENDPDTGVKHGKPVVEDFSLTVRKGEFLAITGESGCGKSTVVKLLLGLYQPDEGRRFVRTAEGDAELTGRYQRLFAYVPQGNMLTRGSIRTVLSFGDEKLAADDGALWEALVLACADDFVRAMDGGLDAELGELGAGLSEGQTQRLSIARAIASGHPVIILDESTSALDPATEERLLENLRGLSGRTLVIVTHRQSVVDACDSRLQLGRNL